MDLQLRDLKYFETVATLGHMGQAGEKLGRTQPALTKGIQRLELAFDSPLFEREGRGIRLTAVGEVLLARTRLLRAAADETVREVRDFAQGKSGHVRIGTGPIAADDVLPQVCGLLLAQARQVTIAITVGASSALREELRQGQSPTCCSGQMPEGDPEFACHPDHRRRGRGRCPRVRTRSSNVRRRRCARCWTTPGCCRPHRSQADSGSTPRSRAAACPSRARRSRPSSIPLLPRLIASSDLLSFISRQTLGSGGRGGLREVALKETTLTRKLGVSHRKKEGYLSPAAKQLLTLLTLRGPEIFSKVNRIGAG